MKNYDFEVIVQDGMVIITQTRSYGMAGEDAEIFISPDQAASLAKSILEAGESVE